MTMSANAMNASAVVAPVPKPPLKRASVVFIDTQLPLSFPAFNKSPGAEYDPFSDRYLSRKSTANENDRQHIPARPSLPETEAMKFWSHIFPESMEKLKRDSDEPKALASSSYSIRSQKDWESVRRTLVRARDGYAGPTKEEAKSSKNNLFQRFLKTAYRRTADHSEQLRALAKIGEKIEYVSPVLAAVGILLDAASRASEGREQIMNAFDPTDLEHNFGDIEFFLSTFPKDAVIKDRSIDLVASIFKGIEDAVGFFISSPVSRGFKAVVKQSDYQKDLLESIDKITQCSDRLLQEGQKSDIYSSRAAHQTIISHIDRLLEAVFLNSERLKELADQDRGAKMLTIFKQLLDDAEEREVRKLEARERRFEQEIEERRRRLEERERKLEGVEEERERRERRRERRERRREERERKRLEMLGSIQDEIRRQNTPSPLLFPFLVGMNQSFPQQFPATYDPSTVSMPTSWYPPLSVPPMWLAPPQPFQQPTLPQLSSADILGILKTPALEQADLRRILDRRYQVDTRSRSNAEAVFLSKTFRGWLTKPKSTELLVHGNADDGDSEVSGVSLLTATLFQALASREKYISLVFFCGLHTEDDDEYVGGLAMVKSFIAQLLRQYEFTNLANLQEGGIELEQLRRGKIKTLCKLLFWLVSQLPEGIKVIYIVDQIGKYENDTHEAKMLTVLTTILEQVHDSEIACTVKVIATSDEATDAVRDVFRDDDKCQLDLDDLDDECPVLDEYGSGVKLPDDDDGDDSSTTSGSEE
ncbi:hypothetical protein B0T16DRAFT_411573 [Cercophora newfieldiana]|uniref:Uncharacterized protein n=1 Tax=Cercophora newfieldiana TaxID=92897 RepID=A0AA39Y5V3_9PEZI|nr:hypothetical protein B0T16DRAFT_411573 [Cercophora newfieldiana]